MTSEEEVKKLCAECKETFGRLDLVVNCAGVIVQTPDTMLYDPEQRVLHDLEQFRRVLEVCSFFFKEKKIATIKDFKM